MGVSRENAYSPTAPWPDLALFLIHHFVYFLETFHHQPKIISTILCQVRKSRLWFFRPCLYYTRSISLAPVV